MRHAIRIVKISCPTCGQESLRPMRLSLQDAVNGLNSEAIKVRSTVDCIDCVLKRERNPARQYEMTQFRLLWKMAGGKEEDMPAAVRLPHDPKPKPLRPVLVTGDQLQPTVRFPVSPRTEPEWKQLSSKPIPPTPARVRPKVLFVSHDLSLTGAPKVLLYLLPRFRGMDVRVRALKPGPLADNFRRACVEVLDKDDYAWPNLVVCNTLLTINAVEEYHKRGVPVVWWIHEWNAGWLGQDDRLRDTINWPTRLVFVHNAQMENFAHLRSRNVTVVNTAVPPRPRMRYDESRSALGFKPDEFVVLTLGRDEPRKGHEDIRAATKDLKVKVVTVSHDKRPHLFLGACDVYVCSSREESFPLAIQEAKQQGKPVIATDLPACQDMIEHGVNGLLYPVGKPNILRDRIVSLQDDAIFRQQLGQAPLRMPSYEECLTKYERLFLSEAGGQAADALHVVYHIACLGPDWQSIIAEQLDQLSACGIRNFFATHVGDNLDWCIAAARQRGLHMIVADHRDSVHAYERPAIELIERLAASDDLPVLYLHAKGVSHPPEATLYHEWRRLQMDELVAKWRTHLLALDQYEAVGVNWWTARDKEHFSGNFWLAKAEWLRQLPPIAHYWRDRFSAERWIGSKPGCKAKTLVCSDCAFWGKDRKVLENARRVYNLRE